MIAHVASNKRPKYSGGMAGRELVHLNEQLGHDRLVADYFAEVPVCSEITFRRLQAFRMLAYGASDNSLDESLRIAENTII